LSGCAEFGLCNLEWEGRGETAAAAALLNCFADTDPVFRLGTIQIALDLYDVIAAVGNAFER